MSVKENPDRKKKSKKARNNAGKKRKPYQQLSSSNHIRNYLGAQQRILDKGNNRKENDKETCIIVIN